MTRNAAFRISSALLCAVAVFAPALAGAQGQRQILARHALQRAVRYAFKTLDNGGDPRYNVLTGINNAGVISGYYGDGSAKHPAQGYTIAPPYGASNYTLVHVKAAAQTQAIAIDNAGNILGTTISAGSDVPASFVAWDGRVRKLGKRIGLQGLNDAGDSLSQKAQGSTVVVAVFNVLTHHSKPVPGDFGNNNEGTGINDGGDVIGLSFAPPPIMHVNGWAVFGGSVYSISAYQGCCTWAFGINNNDEIVGMYGGVELSGSHGFVVTNLATKPQYETVDDPRGVGTVVNAVNDSGALVGEYIDTAGNTHGFLATPR